jgi:uncharacterized Tic20 family protein
MDTPPPLEPRPESSGPAIEMVPATSSEHTRSWCIGLHLSGFSGILLGWSLMHILAPLAIWLIKRADSPEIDTEGKEVLNFQISYSIYGVIAATLCWISAVLCVVLVGLALLPIALILLGTIIVTWIVCMIIAAVKVSNGESYRYPFTIRFLK